MLSLVTHLESVRADAMEKYPATPRPNIPGLIGGSARGVCNDQWGWICKSL